jgi:hypothetical protein
MEDMASVNDAETLGVEVARGGGLKRDINEQKKIWKRITLNGVVGQEPPPLDQYT